MELSALNAIADLVEVQATGLLDVTPNRLAPGVDDRECRGKRRERCRDDSRAGWQVGTTQRDLAGHRAHLRPRQRVAHPTSRRIPARTRAPPRPAPAIHCVQPGRRLRSHRREYPAIDAQSRLRVSVLVAFPHNAILRNDSDCYALVTPTDAHWPSPRDAVRPAPARSARGRRRGQWTHNCNRDQAGRSSTPSRVRNNRPATHPAGTHSIGEKLAKLKARI